MANFNNKHDIKKYGGHMDFNIQQYLEKENYVEMVYCGAYGNVAPDYDKVMTVFNAAQYGAAFNAEFRIIENKTKSNKAGK